MDSFLRYLARNVPAMFLMCRWVPQYYPKQAVISDHLPPGHPERLSHRLLDRTERRIWAHLADLGRFDGQAGRD
jgi:hypothetical protein